MRYMLFLITFIYCTGLAAAELTVTACASATVTQTTIPQLIHDFSEECIDLSSSLEANRVLHSYGDDKTIENAQRDFC